MTKSTLLHLRLPFSFFLLPIFLLAACAAPEIDWMNFLLAFVSLHVFLYPAANAFNSHYDRDTDSIGGLKEPPAVEKELLPVSLAFDLIALVIALAISWQFAAALALYSLCSKLYSHGKIRLKKRPIASWLGTSVVQGAFIFLASYYAIQSSGRINAAPSTGTFLLASFTSLILFAFYPITQIYQHEEDARRGDKTLSMVLGVKGTILFSGTIFMLAGAIVITYLALELGAMTALNFSALMTPAILEFLAFALAVMKDERNADYERTMKTALLSAVGMNLFCLQLLIVGEKLI